MLHASSPAKIILFGEHAVVYGQPAIAIPVSDIRASAAVQFDDTSRAPIIRVENFEQEFTLTDAAPPEAVKHIHLAIHQIAEKAQLIFPPNGWRLNLSSRIPVGRGMGSSAAISVVLVKIIFQLAAADLDQDTLLQLSFELEKFHHSKPSGIDNTVIALEQPILFQKNKAIQIVDPQPFYFVIGDTGIGKKTSAVVSAVADRYTKNQGEYENIFRAIGEISRQALNALEKGARDTLGNLMNENQYLLEQIGVSHPALDRLINTAKESGAAGAKLCGAGQGGCMIALAADAQQAASISNGLLRAGAANSYITSLTGRSTS